jgi:hypothetical protein
MMDFGFWILDGVCAFFVLGSWFFVEEESKQVKKVSEGMKSDERDAWRSWPFSVVSIQLAVFSRQ